MMYLKGKDTAVHATAMNEDWSMLPLINNTVVTVAPGFVAKKLVLLQDCHLLVTYLFTYSGPFLVISCCLSRDLPLAITSNFVG